MADADPNVSDLFAAIDSWFRYASSILRLSFLGSVGLLAEQALTVPFLAYVSVVLSNLPDA
jgi:hypothetical protein